MVDAKAACDPERARVERTFRAAFSRMAGATSEEAALDETSNLLHHVYRLAELTRRRVGDPSTLEDLYRRTPGARGALWARTFDTHEVASVTVLEDRFTDTFTDLWGDVCWRQLDAAAGFADDKKGRSRDYEEHLAQHGVLDSLRAVFEGLLTTLPPPSRAHAAS